MSGHSSSESCQSAGNIFTQCFQEVADRFSAMAVLAFFVQWKLGKRLSQVREVEERIIPEASAPPRLGQELARGFARKCSPESGRYGQCDRTNVFSCMFSRRQAF